MPSLTSALPFPLPAEIGQIGHSSLIVSDGFSISFTESSSVTVGTVLPVGDTNILAFSLPTILKKPPGTFYSVTDALSLTFSESQSITTGTTGAILTKTASDSASLSLTEGTSSVGAYTTVPIAASDTISITGDDSSTEGRSGVYPHGLRADDLNIRFYDSAHAYPESVLTEASIIIPPVIKFAEPRIKGIGLAGGLNGTSADNSIQACKDLADILTRANWTLVDSIPAVGLMNISSIPVYEPGGGGLPYPLSFMNFQARIGRLRYNINFSFFDPEGYSPGAPDPTLVLAEMGTTNAASLANLASAISGSTPFDATIETPTSGYLFTLKLTAKVPGPDGNTYKFSGGYYTPGCSPSHGGFVMDSMDTSIDDVSQTVLSLTIMVGDSDLLCFRCDVGGIAMESTLSGNTATSDPRRSTNLSMGGAVFNVFADPYQLFLSAPDDSYIGGCTAMYFASPWISPNADVGECAFLRVGFTLARNSLYNYYNAAVLVDGEIYDQTIVGHDITQGWGMLMDHQPTYGVKLWTPSDPRFYQDAVVLMSKGNKPMKAVGYLYNAFLTGEEPTDAAIGSSRYLKISGKIYTCEVMANNSTWAAGQAAHGILYLITE